jgi:RecA-family ATPase
MRCLPCPSSSSSSFFLVVQWEGVHLRVDRAVPSSNIKKESGAPIKRQIKADAVVYDPMRSVFVGNLHIDVEV